MFAKLVPFKIKLFVPTLTWVPYTVTQCIFKIYKTGN